MLVNGSVRLVSVEQSKIKHGMTSIGCETCFNVAIYREHGSGRHYCSKTCQLNHHEQHKLIGAGCLQDEGQQRIFTIKNVEEAIENDEMALLRLALTETRSRCALTATDKAGLEEALLTTTLPLSYELYVKALRFLNSKAMLSEQSENYYFPHADRVLVAQRRRFNVLGSPRDNERIVALVKGDGTEFNYVGVTRRGAPDTATTKPKKPQFGQFDQFGPTNVFHPLRR